MSRVVSGYFITFDQPSLDLGGFVEIVRPGSLDLTLRRDADRIRALWAHDHAAVLGRLSARTLTLHTDAVGLAGEIMVPTWAANHYETIERGDVDAASFGFEVPEGGDLWRIDDHDRIVRELHVIRLFEISPVSYPAYPSTSIGVKTRSATTATQRRIATALRLAR